MIRENDAAMLGLKFSFKPICGSIELKRRTVQSYGEINFFLLEESRFYDAANNTFLGGSVRVK